MISENTSGALSDRVHTMIEKFHKDLLGIVIFGSYARGEQHDNPDIDLLIVLSHNVLRNRSLYDMQTIDNISLHLAHLPPSAETSSSLWLEDSIDGNILYGQSHKVDDTARVVRAFVSSGKVVRRETPGQGYWARH